MHEFSLYSQIPHGRHNQVLQIMAGVTGSRPVDYKQQEIIYQQLKASNAQAKKGAAKVTASNQAARLTYQKLTRDCSPTDLSTGGPTWTLRIDDVPEPGIKTVISRAASETIASNAELEKFVQDSAWFTYVKQFIVFGARFISGNVIIRISRIMVPFQASTEDPLTAAVPEDEALRPLDPSGAYLIEACVRTEDGASSQLRDKAVEELLAMCKVLDGSIDFRVPDRLSLDPRVKAN